MGAKVVPAMLDNVRDSVMTEPQPEAARRRLAMSVVNLSCVCAIARRVIEVSASGSTVGTATRQFFTG
jgi:hypothetical protein